MSPTSTVSTTGSTRPETRRCDDCPYVHRKLAGSSGPFDARIVVIGEAPGSQEARKGVPFIGPAGQMLDHTLERAGLSREDCYVTNALLCQPDEAPPAPAAIDACKNRLWEELAEYDRDVIIAFGNTAMRAVLDNQKLKITQERGKLFQDPLGKVVPTFHPASVLRNRSEWPKLLADVEYAASLANGGAVREPGACEYTIVETAEEAEKWVDLLLGYQRLAADFETDRFSPRSGNILCLGVAYETNKAVIFTDDLWYDQGEQNYRGYHQMVRLLESAGPKWIWHNGKFDASFARSHGIEARVDEDTMLMHYALDENKGGHGLEQLAGDLLGAPDWKKKMKADYPEAKLSYAFVPRAVLYDYLARDVDSTLQIWDILSQKLVVSKSLTKLYEKLFIPASEFLLRVEQRGIYVDRNYMAELEVVFTQQQEEAEAAFLAEADKYWDPEKYAKQVGAKKVPKFLNLRSWKQKVWLLRQMGFDVDSAGEVSLRRADQGLPSFEREVSRAVTRGSNKQRALALLKAHGVDKSKPLKNSTIKAIIDWTLANRNLQQWIYGLQEHIEDDGRIHSTYLIHGTETGRLSSRNPNLQNVTAPRKGDTHPVRNLFTSAPGNLLVELDYSQVELRLLAHFSDDDFLLGVYADGRDLHTEVALAMFGEGYSYAQRMRAKAVNFGIAYGRGAESLAAEFGIPKEEAAAMREAWFERLPKAAAFIKANQAKAQSGQTMISPFGRRRRFGLVTKETLPTLKNEASNFPMQSTASDLTLRSAMHIDEWLREEGIEPGVINLVHDSILLEVPEAEAERIGLHAQKLMRAVPKAILKPKILFDTSMAIGHKWGELK